VSEAARLLDRIVRALDAAAVPHMLAGSYASGMHGMPRSTQDIDIVIDPTFDSLEKFLHALKGDDVYFDPDVAREEFKRRSQFNVVDNATFWKADLIFRKARSFSQSELDRRIRATVLGVNVFVASAEDTVLAKLEWAKLGESERQLRDVRGILDVKGALLDTAYIERWLDDLGVRDLWNRVQTG
jgi:hypothetical protein